MNSKYLSVQRQLSNLYPEYYELSDNNTNPERLEYLIDIISALESILIKYLKYERTHYRPY